MAENVMPESQTVAETGSINISNDVVSTVASLAASSVGGVSGMVSSISGGFAELLGKKNMSKGVKVSVTDKKATLDLAIIVEYGTKIPDIAWEIQEKVKSEVEAMTGLTVAAVNVSVEGVNVPKDSHDAQDTTLKDEVIEIADDAKDIASDVISDVKEKAEDVFEFANEKSEDIKESVSEIVDDIKNAVDEGAEKVTD